MAEEFKSAREVFEKRISESLKTAPEKARTINATYKFEITGENGGIWTVDLKSDPPTCKEIDSDAECTIIVGDKDFVDIVNGKLNPQMAFMTGKLKVKGNMAHALKLQQIIKG